MKHTKEIGSINDPILKKEKKTKNKNENKLKKNLKN